MAAAVIVFTAIAGHSEAAIAPFMDVPASHWAYDAVATLAARGVISGYPDGTWKGARPTTRYEMASALARALALVDMERASKQDVEMLKRLVVEFKDELDTLGVRVDSLDSRVAVFEKDLGGWQMSGELRFDVKTGNDKDFYADAYEMHGKNEFDLNRYRIFLSKRINETTSFFTRIGNGTDRGSAGWEEYYIRTRLPWDVTLTVGRMEVDWEGDLGFYIDEGAYFAHFDPITMLMLEKDWGLANIKLMVGRINDATGIFPAEDIDPDEYEKFLVAGLANFDFNERFRAGLMAHWFFSNGDEMRPALASGTIDDKFDNDTFTISAYAGYRFTPAVELKGLLYWQKQGDGFKSLTGEDDAKMWRLILDVQQDALKFTSLWIEYGQMDNNFHNAWGGDSPYADMGADIWADRDWNTNTSKFFGIRADQEWSDKWRTFVRYWHVDYDTVGQDDAKQWGLGAAYRLNEAVEFELAYDKVDYGSVNGENVGGEGRIGYDDLIRFRTFVAF